MREHIFEVGWGMRRLYLTTPGKELDGKERCKNPRKNPYKKPCKESTKWPKISQEALDVSARSQLFPNSFPTVLGKSWERVGFDIKSARTPHELCKNPCKNPAGPGKELRILAGHSVVFRFVLAVCLAGNLVWKPSH